MNTTSSSTPQASLLVARYAGKPELRQVVEAAVRVQQDNDQAVAYGLAGALLLEKVVLVSLGWGGVGRGGAGWGGAGWGGAGGGGLRRVAAKAWPRCSFAFCHAATSPHPYGITFAMPPVTDAHSRSAPPPAHLPPLHTRTRSRSPFLHTHTP